MRITVDQIVEETHSLPPDVVTELVDRILLDMHGGQNPEHATEWSRIIGRRIEEIRSGTVEGISGEVTAAKIRQIVGR